ncbi:MAG TPA: hypothetical protein PKH98_04915, partial [Candidatus Omnitrophota bacterium]|nr:hypothetical protein [Candidatus Omnitrophota bacterium]
MIVFCFFVTTIIPPSFAQAIYLPNPGVMILTSVGYKPAIVKGITIYPDNPLQFDFIIDSGEEHIEGALLKSESNKMIKYFLASLTVPEKE